MPTTSRRRTALAVAVGLGLVAFCLYAATLTRRPSGDALGWAWIAEAGSLPSRLEPHHVLLHPLAWAWFALARAAGLAQRALVPVALLSALGAALTTATLGGLATALSGRARLGLLVGAGFAVSAGPWLYAVDAEPVPLALAAGLAVLAVLLLWPADRRGRAAFGWGLGLAIGLAALVYVTHLALLPAAWAVLALTPDLDRTTRRRQALRLTGGALAPAALGYVAAVFVSHGLAALTDPAAWLPTGAGVRYGVPGPGSLPHGVYAFLRSLLGHPGVGIGDSSARLWASADGLTRALFVTGYALMLAVALTPIAVAWRRRAALPSGLRTVLAALAVWAAAYALFAVLWVPGELDFWLPVVAAWWLGTGLLVGALLPAKAGWSRPELALGALVLALAVANAYSLIVPQRFASPARDWRAATELAANMEPDALAIVVANGRLGAYTGYLTRGRATGEWLFRDRSVAEAIGDARQRGLGAIYFVGSPEDPAVSNALRAVGVDPAAIAGLGRPTDWAAAGLPVWRLEP